MRIDANTLRTVKVSEKAKTFMELNGLNVNHLYPAWEKQKEFAADYDLLIQCMAYAVQKNRFAVAERIYMKFNKARRLLEMSTLTKGGAPIDDCLR